MDRIEPKLSDLLLLNASEENIREALLLRVQWRGCKFLVASNHAIDGNKHNLNPRHFSVTRLH